MHADLANLASVAVDLGEKTPEPLEVCAKAMSPMRSHDQRGPWRPGVGCGGGGGGGKSAAASRSTKGRAQDHGPQVTQRALLLAGCRTTDPL